MILAAGLGTRFKPWTDHHPKALALVNGKTLLQRNIEYLQRAGIDEVVVNVHHFADQIVAAIEKHGGWGSKIILSDEREEVLETGGGLLKAAVHLQDDAFVLMNADVLTDLSLRAMITAHRNAGPLATLATATRTSSRYFLFDQEDILCGWTNTATGEERIVRQATAVVPKAFSGIHVIDPRIFGLISQRGKFSMVDAYLSLAATEIIRSFNHSGTSFVDVGRPASVLEAERLFP